MMGLPIEPVYLLSSVPGDVASAIGTAGGIAIGWLAKRNDFLGQQNRADNQAHAAATIELLNAIHAKELAALKAKKGVA